MARFHRYDPAEVVAVELSDRERYMLWRGVLEWHGPANTTDAVSRVIGDEDRHQMFDDADRLHQLLRDRLPMTRKDWTRILVATEIVFISEPVGAAGDWPITTGISDQESFDLLRRIQCKLLPVILDERDH